MVRPLHWSSCLLLLGSACTPSLQPGDSVQLVVAHRGASAYAPEHTRAAYQLAIDQKAEVVEQDLQVTRDGQLICLHDETLDRTTDVASVFPDRFREEAGLGGPRRHWYARDFDLSEIRQLDAGRWFSPQFAGERIPTFAEAIELIRGQAGLFPELKAPSTQRAEGFDMVKLVAEALKQAGLFDPGADHATPVYLQSFDLSSLIRLREELGCRLPMILLLGAERAGSLSGELDDLAAQVDGIGPAKLLLRQQPEVAEKARRLGLLLFPYTFTSTRPDPSFPDLTAEMRYYLDLGANGLFTDNPDLFPR